MNTAIKKKILLSWLWVILCTLTIFLLIPFANAIQRFVSNNLGSRVFIYLALIMLALMFICLIYLLIYRLKIRSPSNYIWLFIITGLYAYFTLRMRKSPVEVTHFLEYGLLSIFIFRALKHHIRNKTIYLSTALIILLIGTFDEIIQWIVPGRVWNFKDVRLNVISGGLIQLAIWQVIRPKSMSEKISPKSLGLLTSLFVFCLIIIGLCVSNTPNRVYRYTTQIPWLSFLQKEESMSEFGYKYKDSEIGVFYSRLSPKMLQKIDKQRGEESAQVLNKTVYMNYEQFIKEYNSISNPFLHELRVHIFRRNKYFEKGNKVSYLNKKKEFYLIAYKENLILEKYFSHSIERSVYHWNKDFLQESEVSVNKSKPYESPVSANLFTSFSEKTMWVSIFALISFLVLLNLILPSTKIMD